MPQWGTSYQVSETAYLDQEKITWIEQRALIHSFTDEMQQI